MYLDIVVFTDEASGDEGADAQAVEEPIGVIHLRADRSDCGHRAEEAVRACIRGGTHTPTRDATDEAQIEGNKPNANMLVQVGFVVEEEKL